MLEYVAGFQPNGTVLWASSKVLRVIEKDTNNAMYLFDA